MNRRDFVSRVVLGGAAAACTSFAGSAYAAPAPTNSFKFRFIGLMGFVERKDRSFLVATPGDDHHHATHVPFLMARRGSAIAEALDMTPVNGVVPAAFDTELVGSRPEDFVYRSLANTAIEVTSGTTDRVINDANQMAHLHQIAPGKRLRGNLEKWATSTISLRGGRIENSAAHPDAGKLWSFGSYRQRLTDAVNYRNLPGASATLRLTSGADVHTVTIEAAQSAEVWMISSAAMDSRMNDPMALVHSEVLFNFLVDAKPVIAECAEALGREVPATALPFVKPTSASAGLVASEAAIPPFTDLCFVCDILLGTEQ
jgi:hypothetical protein